MKKSILLSMSLVFGVCYFLLAQPGALDMGFGINGKVTTNIGESNEGARAVAIQPDGKIVAVGWSKSNFALSRYHINGTLDAGFNAGGTIIGNPNSYSGYTWSANSVALQQSGKIILGGDLYEEEETIGFLFRYHTDGTLDPTFYPSFHGVNSILLSSDDKIVTAGFDSDGYSYYEAHLIRHNSNGEPDSTFGSGGKVLLENENSNSKATLQADGKILVTGTIYSNGSNQFAIERYLTDGTPDESFGDNGLFVIPGPDLGLTMTSAIQLNGKIIVAGIGWNGNNYELHLARSTSDGILDETFGFNGIVTTDFSGGDDKISMAIQEDDKILVAGTLNGDFAVLRYHPDGTLDDSFGSNGIVTTDFNGDSDEANAIVLQPDGKIIVAGESDGDFAIARYLSGLETGVLEKAETAASSIYLFPNPATDFIQLQLPEVITTPSEISLFDSQGKLLEQQIYSARQTIPIAHLPSGFYTLKLTDGEQAYEGRFVKQ